MNIPRVLATVGAAGGMGYLAITYMGDFKTPGMKNIENRHAAAGGGHTHTPSIASKLGDEQDVATRAEKDKGMWWLPYTLRLSHFRGNQGWLCSIHGISVQRWG